MEENREQLGWWARFKARSRDEFQLVVRNNHTYDEVGSYNLTPLNLYILFSTLFVLLAIFVFLLIAYTPLRQYVPGYGDVVARREMTALEDELEALSSIVEQQDLYIENIRRAWYADDVTVDSLGDRGSDIVDDEEIDPLPPSEEEIRLRREMELERIGQSAGGRPSPGSDRVPLAQLFLSSPLSGEISAAFRPADGHYGVDILAPQNTPIKTVRDGIVIISEFTPEHGNVIGIQHDNNLITFYKHNSQLLKETGDRVRAGEAVAIIGNTGTRSSGPHLHFEMWHEGRVVDPQEFVSF